MIFKAFIYCVISAILTSLLLLFNRGYPAEPPLLIRGAQINSLETRSWDEVEKLWDKLKASGVNTVIVRVFKNPGDRSLFSGHYEQVRSGVYFRSKHAPVIEDLLGPLIKLSHAKGLKIFAWMTTRNCSWKLDQREDLREYIYDLAANKIVPSNKGLNIFHPEAKDYLKKLYQDLARYTLDGILLQDDLVLRHNEGFNPIARASYLEKTGKFLLPAALYQGIKKPPNGNVFVTQYTPEFWYWTRWKQGYLQDFLRYLVGSIKSVNPDIKIALNLYYETIISPEKSLAWYSQTLSGLLAIPLDYFVVMAYHRQIQKELGLNPGATCDVLGKIPGLLLNQITPPEKAVIKIQMVDWEKGELIPMEEIERTFNLLSPYNQISLIFTPTHKDLPLELIKRYYSSSQESRVRGQKYKGRLSGLRE